VKLIAYIDGSSLGNPGESGYGVILKNGKGEILKSVGRHIGVSTNNVAEYKALLACLELVKEYENPKVTVYSDSQLLVNQLKGIYRVKNPHLKTLFIRSLKIIRAGRIDFEICYIPRGKNKDADRLARQAVYLHPGHTETFGDSQGKNG
jgi:ribonuclease HI